MATATISKIQQTIYDNATAGVSYTITQMVELAKEFAEDTTLDTPGSVLSYELIMTEIEGLVQHNFFDAEPVGGGDVTDLDDWRFTKDANPTDPASYPGEDPDGVTIPWNPQGEDVYGAYE